MKTLQVTIGLDTATRIDDLKQIVANSDNETPTIQLWHNAFLLVDRANESQMVAYDAMFNPSNLTHHDNAPTANNNVLANLEKAIKNAISQGVLDFDKDFNAHLDQNLKKIHQDLRIVPLVGISPLNDVYHLLYLANQDSENDLELSQAQEYTLNYFKGVIENVGVMGLVEVKENNEILDSIDIAELLNDAYEYDKNEIIETFADLYPHHKDLLAILETDLPADFKDLDHYWLIKMFGSLRIAKLLIGDKV